MEVSLRTRRITPVRAIWWLRVGITLLGVAIVAGLSTSMAVSSATPPVPGQTGPSAHVSNVNNNRSDNVNNNRSDSVSDARTRLSEPTATPSPTPPPPSQTADAYVTNAGSDTVSVIDTATNTVTATIPVGSTPVRAAVTPDGTRAYVTNAGSDTVSVIDTATNTVTTTIPVGNVPVGVAIAPTT